MVGPPNFWTPRSVYPRIYGPGAVYPRIDGPGVQIILGQVDPVTLKTHPPNSNPPVRFALANRDL